MNPLQKKWTKLEDDIIKAAIMKYGLNNWSKVSSLLDGKSPDECRDRWEIITPRNTDFTKEELISLLDTYKIFPNQWNLISKCMKNKSAEQCQDAYNKILSDDIDLIKIKEKVPLPKKCFSLKKAFNLKKEDDENKKDVLRFVTARLENKKGRKGIKKEKNILKKS